MTFIGWIQIALFCAALLLLVKPMGNYIAQVMEEGNSPLESALGWLENLSYRICGVNPAAQMTWREYSFALLAFSLFGGLVTYAVLRLQGSLPFNPMAFSTSGAPAYATAMTPDLAFNTTCSFVTNTNWQNYSGENTLSYFSQMCGLAVHNWTSAAVGLAASMAVIRGFARHSTHELGNFWKDLTRGLLYILFPLCVIYTIMLVWQGVPQNFAPYTVANTLEGAKQIIPQGPIASQESIKMLGINGGGFLNANSAHPFENPTPISNFIEMLSMLLLPAGLTYTFGKLVGDTRQGWALLIAMFILFFVGTGVCYFFESAGNPNFPARTIEQSTQVLGDLGGNQEGKEVRFGLANSALFASVTTDASCGAVNSMHDSYTPIGGLVPLLNIQLGEVVFGGVGSGLYGMLVFTILTVFIAGLMVGRTPEYVGKKIEQKDVKMSMLFVLVACASILLLTAAGANTNLPLKSEINPPGATFNNVNNGGPHGFSEVLYCYSSCTGNNGSAFGGLTGNTPFYNITSGLAAMLGRFLMMIPVLALAGSLASKKSVPPSSGTFPTHGLLFVVLLLSVIVIVGALTFFPALTLGPIVEHYLMHAGRLF